MKTTEKMSRCYEQHRWHCYPCPYFLFCWEDWVINADGFFYACQVISLIAPKGRCSLGRCFQLGALQDQPLPHHSSPQAHPPPHRTSVPTSWGSAFLPACTAGCSLATVAPKFLLLQKVMTPCCCLHQPRVVPCQGRSSKKLNKGKCKIQ